MKYKLLYILIFSFFSCFISHAQVASTHAVQQESDTTLSIPGEFDNTLDFLTHSWVMQRTKRSNCQTSDNIEVSDSICKIRLSKMPCLLEMPFNRAVRACIDLYTIQKRPVVEYMLGMSQYYFPLFEQHLTENNMPLELKYLTIVESALNTTIVSRMGAAGLWQLMIGTGRMYGLEINTLVDERLSPLHATKAAVKFMKDLYSIYGDWYLVIAAYNCGPGNVNKAIRRAGGKRDYWAIYPYLPRETRGYVPFFIAANYTMNYAPHHNICPAIVNMPSITDTIMVRQRIHFEQIASVLNMPIDEIRLLNAQYKKDIIPGDIKPYSLSLPLNYANNFISRINEIANYKADSLINNRRTVVEIPQAAPISLGGSGKIIFHKVRKGQTLSDIADKYGVTVQKVKSWNRLKGSKIKIGQRIKIIKS